MSKPYIVAIFADCEFISIEPHAVEECADAYADGVLRGNGLVRQSYPPSVRAYVLPRDTEDMREEGEEFDRAMEAYAAEMDQQRLAEMLDGDE